MPSNPYLDFGLKLKSIRLKSKQSIEELSSLFELDVEVLNQIEKGAHQPSEELVYMIISHYSIVDDEAEVLWKLAGYLENTNVPIDQPIPKNHKAYLAVGDIRILYTDIVNVKANKYGVVFDFLQTLGSDDNNIAVSRIGMSREHAQNFLKVLTETLNLSAENNKKQDNPKSVD